MIPHLTFTHPSAFWLLLPGLLALGIALRRRPPLLPVPALPSIPAAAHHRRRIHLVPACLILALLLLIAAAAGPTLIRSRTTWRQPGLHLLIALDFSGSMQAVEPFPDNTPPGPNRIEAARRELLQLLDSNIAESCGLVGFAGSAFLVAPLSPYPEILRARLNHLNTEDFDDGTALGAAIAAATTALQDAPATSRRVILLVSDGVDHSLLPPAPADAARAAAAADIRLFCVGIGGADAWHPVHTPAGLRWQAVGEPADWQQLRQLASLGQGVCLTVDALPRLPELFQQLQTQLPAPPVPVTQTRSQPLAIPATLTALFLLAFAARKPT